MWNKKILPKEKTSKMGLSRNWMVFLFEVTQKTPPHLSQQMNTQQANMPPLPLPPLPPLPAPPVRTVSAPVYTFACRACNRMACLETQWAVFCPFCGVSFGQRMWNCHSCDWVTLYQGTTLAACARCSVSTEGDSGIALDSLPDEVLMHAVYTAQQ